MPLLTLKQLFKQEKTVFWSLSSAQLISYCWYHLVRKYFVIICANISTNIVLWGYFLTPVVIGCGLFSFLEISISTITHNCSLVKQAENCFQIENSSKFEFAPKRQSCEFLWANCGANRRLRGPDRTRELGNWAIGQKLHFWPF